MRACAAVLAALAFAAPAFASEQHPTQGELEAELVCPTCHTPLDESTAPVAQQMKAYIARRIAGGATKSQIVNALVATHNLGSEILGVPRTHGFDLLAWVLPFAGIGLGGGGARRRRLVLVKAPGRRCPAVERPAQLDPELEARVDDELKHFDA